MIGNAWNSGARTSLAQPTPAAVTTGRRRQPTGFPLNTNNEIRYFTYTVVFVPHKSPIKQLSWSPFYWREHWGLEYLSICPRTLNKAVTKTRFFHLSVYLKNSYSSSSPSLPPPQASDCVRKRCELWIGSQKKGILMTLNALGSCLLIQKWKKDVEPVAGAGMTQSASQSAYRALLPFLMSTHMC